MGIPQGQPARSLAFTSHGAFWRSFVAYVQFVAPSIPEARAGTATGLFVRVWWIFTGYMTIAAVRVSGAVVAVFVALFLTFLLLTIGELAGASGVGVVGGVLGLVTPCWPRAPRAPRWSTRPGSVLSSPVWAVRSRGPADRVDVLPVLTVRSRASATSVRQR